MEKNTQHYFEEGPGHPGGFWPGKSKGLLWQLTHASTITPGPLK